MRVAFFPQFSHPIQGGLNREGHSSIYSCLYIFSFVILSPTVMMLILHSVHPFDLWGDFFLLVLPASLILTMQGLAFAILRVRVNKRRKEKRRYNVDRILALSRELCEKYHGTRLIT